MKNQSILSLEPLEQRIAPAAIIAADGRSATFHDLDGDLVTVTVSKGHLDPADFTTKAGLIGDQLQRLNFSDDNGEFDGANLSIVATPDGGLGNGFVDVGWIDSTGHPLGAVFIDGDLAKINAGSSTGIAVTALKAGSIGERGLDTGAPDTSSTLDGAVSKIKILGNIHHAQLNVKGSAGHVAIGGSIEGEGVLDGLAIKNDATNIAINGSVVGGAGFFAGVVSVGGTVGSMEVRGSVVGGSGEAAGIVLCGDAGTVHIHGDLHGGDGSASGGIQTGAGNVTVDGSAVGGKGDYSGRIFVSPPNSALPTKLVVKGGLEGGVGMESGSVDWGALHGTIRIAGGIHGGAGKLSGAVYTDSDPTIASKPIDAISVRGDVTGGAGEYSGSITAKEIHALKVAGSLVGGGGSDSGEIRLRTGHINTFSITGDLRGGSGSRSGAVDFDSGGLPVSVTGGVYHFGGSIIGGSGPFSGSTNLNLTSPVGIFLRGSVIGGSGAGSGNFGASGAPLVIIGGSVVGGTASGSGVVDMVGPDTVEIAGSVIGANLAANATADIDLSGALDFAFVNKLVIGGSVVAGTDYSATKSLTRSGFIDSNSYGSITIGGDVLGSATNRVRIVAEGGFTPGTKVLGALNVAGSMDNTDIAAGFFDTLAPFSADIKVGTVSVGGNWIASNLIVGTLPGQDGAFGTADDILIPGGNAADIASVAKIIIKGLALGDGSASASKYGFSAERIGSASIGGIAIALSVNADTVPIGASGDFSLHDMK